MSRKEAAAEIEAGGRRKEIADETCMKLCEWKPKGGNHRFMMVDKSKAVSTEKSGLFCFLWVKIERADMAMPVSYFSFYRNCKTHPAVLVGTAGESFYSRFCCTGIHFSVYCYAIFYANFHWRLWKFIALYVFG